jgi:endoglucanase
MLKATKVSTFIMLALVTFEFARAEDPKSSAQAAKDRVKAVEMNKLLGRGVNLGNALEAPYEGAWGVTLREEYFQIIKDAGFNSVRLPVRWSGHALTEAPYTIDPKFFKRVDWAINCALSRKLPVILNMHHYTELYTDPLPHKERFMALWKQIAEHYKDYPDTLLLEIYNEPDDALTPEMWNEWLKEAISIIRKYNPTKTIVVDGANDAWITYLRYLELPEDDRNIIVSVHHYFPHDLTHQGAPWITHEKIVKSLEEMKLVGQQLPAWATDDWDGDSNTWMGTKWTGTDEEKKAMTDIFDIGAAWGKEHNRPINLGEFGAINKADMASRVRWTKFIADTAAERGMSLHYWEFCAAEFGLYDQKTKSWHKELLEAVLPPKQ